MNTPRNLVVHRLSWYCERPKNPKSEKLDFFASSNHVQEPSALCTYYLTKPRLGMDHVVADQRTEF